MTKPSDKSPPLFSVLSKMELKKYIEYVTGLFIIVGIVIAIGLTEPRQFLNANSGAVSGMLSALLVLLYLAQYRTQKEQQQLMEANHRSIVEVEDYRAHGEKLILELSNFGNGVATDLELVILPAFEETEYRRPDIFRTKLTRLPEDSNQNRRGKSIKAGEAQIPFEARPVIGLQSVDDSGTHHYGFDMGMDILDNAGIEVMNIYFYLRYRDLLNEYQIDPVVTLEVTPAEEGGKFEWVYFNAGRHGIGFPLGNEPAISADNLEFDLSDVEVPEERTVV